MGSLVRCLASLVRPQHEAMTRADGRFTNLDGSFAQPLSNVLRWAVVDRLQGGVARRPLADVPRVTPDLASLATPPALGEPARLTWLGHASWLVQLERHDAADRPGAIR